jgi:MSHA biogenesis protein MshE
MEIVKNLRLGIALIENGYLTQEKLQEALSEQKRTGRLLGQVLVDSRYITEEQLSRTIAAQQNLPFIDLLKYEVNPEIVRKLSETQVRRFRAIVLEDRTDTYLVGLVDPSNLRAQDELSSLLGRPIYAATITNDQFNKTIDRVFHKENQLDEYANEVKQDLERDGGVVYLNQMSYLIDAIEAPVIKLLQTVFEEAVKMGASDIHIEPEENKLDVRFRIDGELHHQFDADIAIAPALMVRLKLLAGLDIAEKRLPMDGRISVMTETERVDIRMSTIPTQFGESVVMRLLIQSQGLLDLNNIGMSPELLEKFNQLIKLPHGIVLVTGPTGCGKTTTLYGALEKLNRRNVKILTCEDPVEYRIPGIRQVQVNDKIDLTFSRVLRSFLRQDPDILMVGEIRDLETAQIAARAAMTGHMVLSTLHTNDAVTAPGRLLDMGVPGYMIASTLLGVLSQRLLRLLCTYCAEPYSPNAKELEWVKHFYGKDISQANFRQSKGCPRCNGIGFNARIGVFELLEMTPPLYEAIHKGDPLNFVRIARKIMGNNTIDNQALSLAVNGKTTIVEAMTVVSSVEF